MSAARKAKMAHGRRLWIPGIVEPACATDEHIPFAGHRTIAQVDADAHSARMAAA